MATLYVEKVPEDLYEAIRTRAKANRKSISAEVLTLLAENVATPKELAQRRKVFDCARKIRSVHPMSTGPFASSEDMQRGWRMQ